MLESKVVEGMFGPKHHTIVKRMEKHAMRNFIIYTLHQI
jgi:hypothetical protein